MTNNNNNNETEEFSVINFFQGKTIFLTGATGLLGRQLVEKLLHCTEVERIYILVREKRGKSIADRGHEYRKNQLFTFRLKDSPKLDKITVIPGDIEKADLGISPEDRQKLMSECHVMIHSAATVRFDEPLTTAMNMNVKPTLRMLDLASGASKLQAFIYVSTAFTHCYDGTLDEEVAIPTTDPHELLHLMEKQDEQTFNTITMRQVIGPHPNTYTLTKSFSDHLVFERSVNQKLPVAIAKPAIITGPYQEPEPGFCDDLMQAIPLVGTGIGTGITRVIPGHRDHHLPIIPVDTVANSILIITAKTAADACDPDFTPKSYGMFNTGDNIMRQGPAFDTGYEMSVRYPLVKTIRPPAKVIFTRSLLLYRILIFLYETMYAFLLDTLVRSKHSIRKYTASAHKAILLLSFFLLCDWKVYGTRTRKVFQSLSEKEKIIFDIDSIDNIDWPKYIAKYYIGVRKYHWKINDDEETTRKTRDMLYLKTIKYHVLTGIAAASMTVAAYTIISFVMF